MSRPLPFVADGPDRFRQVLARLPAEQRVEWERRLDRDPHGIESPPLPEARLRRGLLMLRRWRRWYGGLPIDRRCFLRPPDTDEPQPNDGRP